MTTRNCCVFIYVPHVTMCADNVHRACEQRKKRRLHVEHILLTVVVLLIERFIFYYCYYYHYRLLFLCFAVQCSCIGLRLTASASERVQCTSSQTESYLKAHNVWLKRQHATHMCINVRHSLDETDGFFFPIR